MTARVTYAYAPDGVTVLRRSLSAPRTLRAQNGRIVSGVRSEVLPSYGYYPERRPDIPPYSDGLERDPVIDLLTREAIYRLIPTDVEVRIERARTEQRATADRAKRRDLRAWIAGDVTGAIWLYDISPDRRADYIGLAPLLDAADAAYPDSAPNTAAITVRAPGTDAESPVLHDASQVRGLLMIGMGYLNAVYQQYHAHLAAIDAATTIAQVEAIAIL